MGISRVADALGVAEEGVVSFSMGALLLWPRGAVEALVSMHEVVMVHIQMVKVESRRVVVAVPAEQEAPRVAEALEEVQIVGSQTVIMVVICKEQTISVAEVMVAAATLVVDVELIIQVSFFL